MYPRRLYEIILQVKVFGTRQSVKLKKKFWWAGATITRIGHLSTDEHSVVECLRWLVFTLVETGSAASFPVTWTSLLQNLETSTPKAHKSNNHGVL